MYAAYQSHQSCGGAIASNGPWRRDVSCNSCARSATSMSHPARETLGDFLQRPGVAVGIGEGCPAEIRAALRVDARHLPRAGFGVPDLAHLDAAADQLVAGGFDVVDGQQHAL